jgi:hypothetical protein
MVLQPEYTNQPATPNDVFSATELYSGCSYSDRNTTINKQHRTMTSLLLNFPTRTQSEYNRNTLINQQQRTMSFLRKISALVVAFPNNQPETPNDDFSPIELFFNFPAPGDTHENE